MKGPALVVNQQEKSPESIKSESHLDMRYLIRALIKYNASDLHIKVGRPPLFRINGKLIAAKMPPISLEQAQETILGVLTERQIKQLEETRQIDFSFNVKDMGRFRCNVYYQRGLISAAVRMIPINVATLDELGVPIVLKELCARLRGLLLITGGTGSGKSTTLASLIQYINQTMQVHVLTIEDPIEYVHQDVKASITQREVGSDTHSLKDALYAGLRQDPDIIMIGEIRDRAMIEGALAAAETGHLVITTLHTNDAKSTIDRIVDVFPPDARSQIRLQLASALVAVVSQQLVDRKDGSGRTLVCEVMVKSPTIEDFILKNELEKIPEIMAKSSSYYKMQTMNMGLEKMVTDGIITPEEALKASNNPDDLRFRLQGFSDNNYSNESAKQVEGSGIVAPSMQDLPEIELFKK
jgi:twitching motility protein PilT